VALLNFIETPNHLDELGLVAWMLDEHLDERSDSGPDGLGVHHRDVATQEPRSLELVESLVDRGRGKTDAARNLGLGQLGVSLDQSQDLAVPEIDRLSSVRLSRHISDYYSAFADHFKRRF